MEKKQETNETTPSKMTCSITIRVSPEEKEHIVKLSEECGFRDVSTYIRARAFNYRPRARLTPYQEKLLENLDGCRSDIYHYQNALGLLSPQERIEYLRQHHFVLDWIKDLAKIGNRLLVFLNAVRKPNKHRWSEEDDEIKEEEQNEKEEEQDAHGDENGKEVEA